LRLTLDFHDGTVTIAEAGQLHTGHTAYQLQISAPSTAFYGQLPKDALCALADVINFFFRRGPEPARVEVMVQQVNATPAPASSQTEGEDEVSVIRRRMIAGR
jgi:hypothetical protein